MGYPGNAGVWNCMGVVLVAKTCLSQVAGWASRLSCLPPPPPPACPCLSHVWLNCCSRQGVQLHVGTPRWGYKKVGCIGGAWWGEETKW